MIVLIISLFFEKWAKYYFGYFSSGLTDCVEIPAFFRK